MTEAEVITLLRRRYGRRYTGNGGNPRYVMAAHVRNQLWGAGQMDFLAMDCSEFRNNTIHGHEIKCSRSDWRRELKQPRKCEVFREVCDYWWLVVSDRAIVHSLDELPVGWGLLYVRGAQVIKALDARANMEVRPMPRGMVASFVRRATSQSLELAS